MRRTGPQFRFSAINYHDSYGFLVFRRRRETPIVKVATRQEQGSGGIADGKFRSGEDPQLVHDSRGTQIVCMNETEKRENGSCHLPSSRGKEEPVEHVGEGS